MYNFKENFYADVRVEDRFTTTISYTNGFLKEIKESPKYKDLFE